MKNQVISKEWLQTLNVGDDVKVNYGNNSLLDPFLAKVTRVTKTYIYVKGDGDYCNFFSRKTGEIRYLDKYTFVYLSPTS
jgi:hypothetical protein